MIVTCPNCQTQFQIDDSAYKPGQKARCSVCSFMFLLPAPEAAEEKIPAPASINSPASPASPPSPRSGPVPILDDLPEGLNDFDSLGDLDAGDTVAFSNVDPDPAGFDEEPDLPLPAKPAKKGGCLKRLVLILTLLLCLSGLGLGAYLIYFQGKLPFDLPFDIPGTTSSGVDPVAERIADIDKVRDLLLIDVSHKYVQNVKLGPLVVITGKVRNNFPTPKEMIRVEATLLDKKGKVLAVQQQYGGIVVPELQLQVLGQKELAQALDNRFDMLANNINVQPGVEVPFMVVFVYPPSTMAEYTVVVADANDPPDLAPQGQNPAQGQGAQPQ